jgi:hypothetical protein
MRWIAELPLFLNPNGLEGRTSEKIKNEIFVFTAQFLEKQNGGSFLCVGHTSKVPCHFQDLTQ